MGFKAARVEESRMKDKHWRRRTAAAAAEQYLADDLVWTVSFFVLSAAETRMGDNERCRDNRPIGRIGIKQIISEGRQLASERARELGLLHQEA